MQVPGFVQQPCSRCGAQVYIAQATGMGICPSCHTQNNLAAAPAAQGYGAPGAAPGYPAPGAAPAAQGYAAPGAAPGAQGYGMPGAAAGYGMPAGGMPNYAAASGGSSMFKAIGGAAAAILVAVLGIGGWYVKSYFFGGGGKGKIGYGQLGIDKSKADGDKMITSVAGLATKWKKDAVWWSVNYQAVRPDGTVILDKGAVVEYVSPSKVQSASKKVREDSIKKFQFSTVGVDFSKKWNATNQWKNVISPPTPQCSIKQLAGQLAKQGLTGEKTVRITYDPQFQNVNVPTWHVIGTDPKIDAYYSHVDCSEVPK
ncbi:MAG: hypothetical protein R3B13_06205 [Polyangiaceae bacterium]